MLNDHAYREGVSCTYIYNVCVGATYDESLAVKVMELALRKCAALQKRFNFQTLQGIITHVVTVMGLCSSEYTVM